MIMNDIHRLADDDFLEAMSDSDLPEENEILEEENNEEEEINDTEEEKEEEGSFEDEEEHISEKEDEGEAESASTEDSDLESESKEEPQSSTEPKDTKQDTFDYKAAYEQILSPFKANGKMIQPRSIDEAIKLMQMGANFTRKMQDIAPHRKTLLMLEKNNLLDEEKLAYLIDLDKREPEAVKKLIKESGVDLMEIDPEEPSKYKTGNRHRVTDKEVAFRATIDEVKSTATGMQTIQVINGWDQASKDMLWDEPSAMILIDEQRENGLYEFISDEVDRQKTLGNIKDTVPFLEAYTQVGNALQQGGHITKYLDHLHGRTQQQRPIETKVAKPKPRVRNNDKASAASQNKVSKKATPLINPLANTSDDEFMRAMGKRL